MKYKSIYKAVQRSLPHELKYKMAVKRIKRYKPYSLMQKGWNVIQVGTSGRLCELGRSQAIIFSKIVGAKQGKVHVFEAIPENIEVFTQYLKQKNINNILVYSHGLWNKTDDIEFYIPADKRKRVTTGTRAVDIRKDEQARFDSIAQLPVKALDDCMGLLKLDKLGLLNITANGAEPEIIEGAIKTITKYKPHIVTPGENEEIRGKIIEILRNVKYEVHVNTTKLHALGRPFTELWATPKQ